MACASGGVFHADEQLNYPLTMIVGMAPDAEVRLDYDRSAFEAAMVGRLAGHLATVLDRHRGRRRRPR